MGSLLPFSQFRIMALHRMRFVFSVSAWFPAVPRYFIHTFDLDTPMQGPPEK